MKIRKIHIDKFGKLSNYSLDFADGCNIIYGNNEDGKSTVMAFIKMMFYGSSGKSGDLAKNVRKRYLPWDGAKMAGSIEFDYNEIGYRIERIFGATNTTDKINLWNLATGEKEGVANLESLGQRFFGIGAEAFEKSVFIGQAGIVMDNSNDKDDEITGRLLNLVSTGDESVSQKKVEKRLQTAKEALKARGGKIGVLDKGYQELSRLGEARVTALEEEARKKQMERQCLELEAQKNALEKVLGEYHKRLEIEDKLERLQGLEQLTKKRQGIDGLIAECNEKKKLLFVGDRQFDMEFLKNAEEKATQIQALREVYSERNRKVLALLEEDKDLETQEITPISQEYVEMVKGKEKELLDVTNLVETLKQRGKLCDEKGKLETLLSGVESELLIAKGNLADGKEKFERDKLALNDLMQQQGNANAEYQVAMSNVKHAEELMKQKMESASEMQKQNFASGNEKRGLNLPMLLAAGVVLVLAVLLGVIVNVAFFAGILLGAVLIVLALPKAKKGTINRVDLGSLTDEALRDKETAENGEKRAKEKLDEIIIQLELIQKGSDKAELELQKLNEIVSGLLQKKSELEIKRQYIDDEISAKSVGDEDLAEIVSKQASLSNEMSALLASKGCGTVDELQNKSIVMQGYQTKLDARNENIVKARADEEEAKDRLKKCGLSFCAFVSAYKPVSNYEEAVHVLQGMKDIFELIATLEVKIKSQSEFIHGEMQDTGEALKEVAEIREQILALNNGVLPQKMSEWETEELGTRIKADTFRMQNIREDLVKINSNIKSEFSNKKNVSQIEDEIRLLKNGMEEKESYFECLEMAETTLLEAFSEIRQSFGPLLNEKTAKIFGTLTGGKYENVIISRNFDINVQDTGSEVSHEWQYLSSGTIDQAYLALRLAVAELLTSENVGLPLLLDDVFLQYDDSRAEQGIRFLMEFLNERAKGTQIILFTCHKRMIDLAGKNNFNVSVRNV